MSTAAGIAAVTAVLKDLLSNGLIDRQVVGAVGDVTVSALPPDRITLPEASSQLNLYLYLVSRNTGWSNVDLPARDQRGSLIGAHSGVCCLSASVLLSFRSRAQRPGHVLRRGCDDALTI